MNLADTTRIVTAATREELENKLEAYDAKQWRVQGVTAHDGYTAVLVRTDPPKPGDTELLYEDKP